MAESFSNSESSCEVCGLITDHGPQLSYHVQVTSKMHLCDKCRKSEKLIIVDDVLSYEKERRMCSDHSDREVELYCSFCRREICMMCGVTTHSGHEKHELKKIVQNRKIDVEKKLNNPNTEENEPLKFQAFVRKSLDRMNQRFDNLRKGVDASAKENMDMIENTRQQKDEKARSDAARQIKEIETMMESKFNCHKIEAEEDTKRVQDATDGNIKVLSALQTAADRKASILTTAVIEDISKISSVQEGQGTSRHDDQAMSSTASIALDETREQPATSDGDYVLKMKALEQLSSHVDQVVWTIDRRNKLGGGNLVSSIWTLKQEYTIKQDPSPCTHYLGSEILIYIDVASGSLYKLDYQSGQSQPINQGNSSYTDCVQVDKDIIALETVKTEMKYAVQLSRLNIQENPTEGRVIFTLNHRTDEPVAVHAAINKKGIIMVAYDGSDIITKVTGHSETAGNILQKMIRLKGKKICGKVLSTPSGKFVIDTGPAEFTVISDYGAIITTICHAEWGYALCGTDPVDDVLYVSYQPDGCDVVRIDEVELDGTLRRRSIVEFKVTGMFSDPIVTCNGLLAICDGKKIRVYKRTPFESVLSTLNMLPTS